MKIALPIDENEKDICVSFGRAPLFMLHDTETGASALHENPGAEAQGGAGIKAAQLVTDLEADVLITVRCGENAAELFKAAGVQIFKAANGSAEENLKLFKENKLEPLTHFHAGFHGVH